MVVNMLKVKTSKMYKQAFVPNSSLIKLAQNIMDIIYKENPEWWPYGLNVEGHDSVYIINDNLTKQAAGFVGWLERKEDNGLLYGSYTVGILPEFRNKHLAKEAVAKLILEKKSGVDKIVSYVRPANIPSKRLALSLNIPVIEEF